ncbi:hypothetical protein Tco_1194592 [Tanacetum coccineum]
MDTNGDAIGYRRTCYYHVIGTSRGTNVGSKFQTGSDKPKKQHTTYDGFEQPSRHTSRGTNVGSKFQYKAKKNVYQAVSKKNGASSRGTKKNYEVSRHEMNSTNSFDALNMIENDDELRSNRGGSSNSGKKVIHEVAGLISGSPSTTPLVVRINELESQMLDGKLVIVGDDRKPLKPRKSTLPSSYNVASKKVDDPVNEDSDDEVLEVYNDTAIFMASTSSNVNKASKSVSGN